MPKLPDRWPLTMELLRWSPRDAWTLQEAVEGVLITGGIGSGKTSGPFSLITRSILRAGCGAVFMCGKKDSTWDFIRLAESAGRKDDVIEFSQEGGHCFNFLTYEANRRGAGRTVIKNVVDVLMQASEATERQIATSDPFWRDSTRQLLTHCLEVVITATGEVRLKQVLEMVRGLPRTREEARMADRGELELFAVELLKVAEAKERERRAGEQNSENPPAQEEHLRPGLTNARSYIFEDWPDMPEKTRESVSATLKALLGEFVGEELLALLGGETTCSPDDVLAGKIVIVNVPVLEFDKIGKIANVVWKCCVQKAIGRRVDRGTPITEETRPVAIFADEYQMFATCQDTDAQNTMRSAKGFHIVASQNLSNFFAEMGGDATSRAKVESLLSNLNTKLGCQNSHSATNEFYSKILGQVIRITESKAVDPWLGTVKGITQSERQEWDLPPRAFIGLKIGGPKHQHIVEAILICKNVRFRASGQHWLKVSFEQEHEAPAWSWPPEWFVKRRLARIS